MPRVFPCQSFAVQPSSDRAKTRWAKVLSAGTDVCRPELTCHNQPRRDLPLLKMAANIASRVLDPALCIYTSYQNHLLRFDKSCSLLTNHPPNAIVHRGQHLAAPLLRSGAAVMAALAMERGACACTGISAEDAGLPACAAAAQLTVTTLRLGSGGAARAVAAAAIAAATRAERANRSS